MTYRLRSKFFFNQDNIQTADTGRLEKAANDHAHCIKRDSQGEHVHAVQMFLVLGNAYDYWRRTYNKTNDAATVWDMMMMFNQESTDYTYGVVTEEVVRLWKELRGIVDHSRQQKADGIVGVLTMRAMDDNMLQIETYGMPEDVDRAEVAKAASHKLKPVILGGLHAVR